MGVLLWRGMVTNPPPQVLYGWHGQRSSLDGLQASVRGDNLKSTSCQRRKSVSRLVSLDGEVTEGRCRLR